MRLQRLVNRKVRDKTYYKWVLTVPGDLIDALGWAPGEALQARLEGEALVLERND